MWWSPTLKRYIKQNENILDISKMEKSYNINRLCRLQKKFKVKIVEFNLIRKIKWEIQSFSQIKKPYGPSIKDVRPKTDFLDPPPPLSDIVRLEDTPPPSPISDVRTVWSVKTPETQKYIAIRIFWTSGWWQTPPRPRSSTLADTPPPFAWTSLMDGPLQWHLTMYISFIRNWRE